MTNREAPRTCFGNGFPPFGSAVSEKSRFALYFFRPTAPNLTADYADETDFAAKLDVFPGVVIPSLARNLTVEVCGTQVLLCDARRFWEILRALRMTAKSYASLGSASPTR